MGKATESKVVKTKRYVNKYTKDLFCNSRNELFCQLFETPVKCDKRFQVEQHSLPAKHQRKMSFVSEKQTLKTQFFLPARQKDFSSNFNMQISKIDTLNFGTPLPF